MLGVPTGALVLAAMLVACDRGDRADADTALTKAVDAIGAATDSAAGRIGGPEFTNAELTAWINGYNDAEIEIGQLAQTKATDAGVRAFAQRIVTDHRALKTEVTNGAKQLSISPTMPADDDDLRDEHQKAMKELNDKAKGKEFDEEFLEHEIDMHKKALDAIDEAIGRSENAELRPLLEKAKAGVQSHLTMAQELEKKFGA
jgi:putative membrane protein